MTEKWFVILIIVIKLINVGVEFGKHGEARKDEYNGWAALIATCIYFTLAWLAGFFTCFE